MNIELHGLLLSISTLTCTISVIYLLRLYRSMEQSLSILTNVIEELLKERITQKGKVVYLKPRP